MRCRSTGEDFSELMFDSLSLTWSTTLSDGRTSLELRPPLHPRDSPPRVSYHDRIQYAQEATVARLQESCLQLQRIRMGLHHVVPRASLALLTWRELEARVCGEPVINIDTLKKHTVYAPAHLYHEHSRVINNFWTVLSEYSDEDRARFLQFVWARSRLPSQMTEEASYRMQINVLEDKLDSLPRSETCFFNLKLPNYPTLEVLFCAEVLCPCILIIFW